MIRLLLHVLGIDDPTSRWYAFWSGFGSDLGEIAVVGAGWRVLNCHESGCWRLAAHHDPTGRRTCHKHRPNR